jgi:hypothetical protein
MIEDFRDLFTGSKQTHGCYIRQATITTFQIPYYLLSTSLRTIRHYVSWATHIFVEKRSKLNKQINNKQIGSSPKNMCIAH